MTALLAARGTARANEQHQPELLTTERASSAIERYERRSWGVAFLWVRIESCRRRTAQQIDCAVVTGIAGEPFNDHGYRVEPEIEAEGLDSARLTARGRVVVREVPPPAGGSLLAP